ncbi:MAG TPA: biopolymer transporter ExbD [Gammaproteobacteria bacterium]|nr:biopolymer transporter ExbD [Gammaproteobacteria bacterium]
MRKRLHRGEESADINITPMLDIVFIMLIFFIVTTSFVKEFGVDVNRPSDTPVEEQQQSEVIAIRIDENDQIYVQDRLVDVRAVRANIESGLAVQPDAAVVVIADRAADAGLLVRVVDQARVAGAERVSLAARAR